MGLKPCLEGMGVSIFLYSSPSTCCSFHRARGCQYTIKVCLHAVLACTCPDLPGSRPQAQQASASSSRLWLSRARWTQTDTYTCADTHSLSCYDTGTSQILDILPTVLNSSHPKHTLPHSLSSTHTSRTGTRFREAASGGTTSRTSETNGNHERGRHHQHHRGRDMHHRHGDHPAVQDRGVEPL